MHYNKIRKVEKMESPMFAYRLLDANGREVTMITEKEADVLREGLRKGVDDDA